MPDFVYPIFGVLLGLIVGSFLATILIRWPKDESIMTGRSQCDSCGKHLRISDLIPVVSFVIRSGKCAFCGSKIQPDHPYIELGAGLIGGIAFYVEPGWSGLLGAGFGWLLLVLAALDAKHLWLPDKLTILLALLGLGSSFWINDPDIINRLIGGVSGFLGLFLIGWVYKIFRKKEGLGGGDPKLLGAIGCWLGWSALPLVVLGAALVGIISLITMRLRHQSITADSALPLGSFMAVTAFPLWIAQTAIGGFIL
ncbi:MAG: prepilin peptidase [Parasphingorhabdus sp.]|uniref:prepilin peptidase n=1 Tax=Parasphingorhabdus sp. TaxID=2709688 RepID=UPI0032979619